MRIVGLDLSLTATGMACVDDTVGIVTVDTTIVKTRPDNGTLKGRSSRLEGISAAVMSFCKAATLVVIESPSYSSGGRGTWDRAGLWWWVVSVLLLTDTSVVEVSPKSRAKWATDSGNSGKNAVAVAIGRLWPEVQLRDDNDSDALVLATMGAQLLGMNVPARAWQAAEIGKLKGRT